MSSPATSRPDPELAVVALSARALARSARRAGLRALAIDLFADGDTREHADEAVRVAPGRDGRGFDGPALLAALRTHAPEGLPVVLGAGFEHAPALMRAIAERNPVLGASPETVLRLKRPDRLAALLAGAGVAHPEIRSADQGEDAGAWLSKRAGASGGAHIRVAARAARGRYLQRRVEGRPVSALFLADGRAARVVGFSEQWTDPSPRAPFRYGGAVGPVSLPPGLAEKIASDLDRLARATGLVGLASADLIVPEHGPYWLIEINPRPGATLDVFDRGDMPSLVALHLAACEGRLPASLPAPGRAQAAAVLYAEAPVSAALVRRPVWTADWPSCEEVVRAGAPFCSIVAAAATPSAARALLEERRAALLASLRAARRPSRRANRMVPA